MTATDALAQLVLQRLGLRPPERPPSVELSARIEARRVALGLPSVEAYLQRVMLSPEPELGHLAAAFTNGWTWFFRDHEAIEALVAKLAELRLGRPLNVWVAGCSSGEEAYGVAIACVDAQLDARVLASDVDASRLEIAARATYDAAALRRVPASVLVRCFEERENGLRRVIAPIRERVELRLHNLLDPAPAPLGPGGWDAIVCRNVLLHCTEEACRVITANLQRALAPHGVLLLGPGDPQVGPPSGRASWTPRTSSPRSPSIVPPPAPVLPPSWAMPVASTSTPPSWAMPVASTSTPPSWAMPGATAPTPVPSPPPVPAPTRLSTPLPIPTPAPAPAPIPTPAPRVAPVDDWTRAVAAIREGQHARARAALEAWLAARPEHVDARLALGNLWLAAHELELAEEAYDRAGAIEPDCAELHFLRGALHRKRGAWTDAAAALRRALFHDPDLWPARFLLAGAWERLGENERARTAWVETLRSLERRPRIAWRSQVDDIEGLACPAERVRALGEQRVRRELGSMGG